MTPDDPVTATEAYDYPLTLDHLLHTGLTCSPAREIVHESRGRLDYRELRRRIGRLAAVLASLGVEPGDPGHPPEEAAIREAAERGRINRWAVPDPDRIVIVESLDRTSVGKIDKKRLRTRYAHS